MPQWHERSFPHHGSSVGEARKFAVDALSTWGVRDRLDDVCQCLSEVATNALVHAGPPSSGFRARLTIGAATVRLEVHDQGAGRPRRRQPSLDDPSGRGLFLVDELSDEWGVDDGHGIGKTIWLTFKVTTGTLRTPECEI
ncbi:ATP-binding protein [Streptomyces caniferus]|uniref:ATP-binding protein n=1 Tax=Streptomyces caniferus TaxID=285557 RepID=UPI002E299910|nr:ATP-binding protein [Streptomyces caniferus]